MKDITGLSGVAVLEKVCITPGHWAVEGWDVRRAGPRRWEATLSYADSCRVRKITALSLGLVCERIAEDRGLA